MYGISPSKKPVRIRAAYINHFQPGMPIFGHVITCDEQRQGHWHGSLDSFYIHTQTDIHLCICVCMCEYPGRRQCLGTGRFPVRLLRFLRRIAPLVGRDTLKTLARALIQPHFDYGVHVWYRDATKALKTKLQTAQNKLIRLLLNLPSQAHLTANNSSSWVGSW